jgi:SAM-dependent methyltransferase
MSKVQAMREDTGPLSVFWERVVDPDGRGMPEAIAEDIASFTGETIGEVLVKMERGKVSLKELWDQSGIDVSDPESIASFYRDQFVEAYELADWHSGRTNGVPPLNYARAALFARKNGLSRALDFGSGIGTGSLCLAEAGCEVHSADIARELLAFVGHRFARRGMRTSMIDLNDPERPTKNYYDIVTCFDVLEHVELL